MTPLARRTAAVTAAAAMISSGGALLAAPAWAVQPAATVQSFSPLAWDNRSTVTLTVNGSGFVAQDPSGQLNDVVVLTPDFTTGTSDPTWKADSTQHTEINPITSAPAAVSASTTSIQVKVNLALAPAGLYTVTVKHADGTPSNVPAAHFEVYGYGGASATGVAAGKSNTGVDPVGAQCRLSLLVNCTPRGAGALDITGSNFAVGATVQFLRNGVADPGLSFREGNPEVSAPTYAGTKAGTGYASSTLLQGNYAYGPLNADSTPSFTPGIHQLKVTNVHQDATATVLTTPFVQPFVPAGGASPNKVGAGAQKVLVTVTGQGFQNGAAVGVEGSTCNNAGDTTVGAATPGGQAADGTFTTLTFPVSFTSCAATGPRSLTVVNPHGEYYTLPSALTVTPRPTFTAVDPTYQTVGQGAVLQSPDHIVTITGTGFAGAGETDPAKMVHFDFGDGVVAVTKAVGGGSAQVDLVVDPDAPVSERSVTVTNPDGGSTTTAPETVNGVRTTTPAPLKVVAGPKITSVSPSSFAADSSGGPVVVTGSFPDTGAVYDVTINGLSVTPNPATRTDATHLGFNVSLPPGTTSGLKKLTITHHTNFGTASCDVCFGINKMQVAPSTSGNNVQAQQLTFTNQDTTLPDLSTALDLTNVNTAKRSTVTLRRQVTVPGQGPIVGTLLAEGPNANQAQATFDLRSVAPGDYSVTIVQDPTANPQVTWTCAACFTVSQAGTVSIASVSPSSVGQGMTGVPVVIAGSNFSKGSDVTIDQVSVHDVKWVSATEIDAKVDVADDATTGTHDVMVTDANGTTTTKAGGFTVAAKPAPISISVTSLGQGAGTDGTPVAVVISGHALTFTASSMPSLGAGITFGAITYHKGTPANCGPLSPPGPCAVPEDPDTLTTTMTVAESTATGAHDLVVTNPPYGGTGTLVGGFTVNAGPKVTSIATEAGQAAVPPDGAKHTLTILGSGFKTGDPTALAIKNLDKTADTKLTVANVQVVDAGKITADVTAATDAALGARLVTVANSSDKGYGTCTTCFAVANPPSVPGSVAVAPVGGGLKVTWTGSSPNGSAVSSYVLSLLRSGSPSTKTAGSCKVGTSTTGVRYDTLASTPGTARSYTFTGLSNGATYYLTMCALNAAGQSPTVAKSGIAGLPDSLSLAVSTSKLTYGSKVTLSGRLLGVGNAPLAGKTVYFVLANYRGNSYTHVTTNSNGYYSLTYAPTYSTTAYTYWLGDASYRLVRSASRSYYVAAKVIRTSPANGTKSAASTTLKITGYVAPNKAGKVVYLYRYTSSGTTLLARATLTSGSYFTFAVKPPRGTYTLRAVIASTPGNTAGYSSFFTLYRT